MARKKKVTRKKGPRARRPEPMPKVEVARKVLSELDTETLRDAGPQELLETVRSSPLYKKHHGASAFHATQIGKVRKKILDLRRRGNGAIDFEPTVSELLEFKKMCARLGGTERVVEMAIALRKFEEV